MANRDFSLFDTPGKPDGRLGSRSEVSKKGLNALTKGGLNAQNKARNEVAPPRCLRAPGSSARAGRAVALCLSALALVLSGCLLTPSTRDPQGPLVRTELHDSLTDATPDIVVPLYAPYRDASLGPEGRSALKLGTPVRVRQAETGRVVEYRYSERGFGSWNEERERQLHLFLLRAFFLHPGVFDDAAAGMLPLDALYERARGHDGYTRSIDPAAAEEHRRQSRTTVRPRVMGIQVRLNDAADTVVIELVAPGSPAHQAGLRRGMSVLAVNGHDVTGDSAGERFSRFAAESPITLLTVGTPAGIRTEAVGRDTASFPTVQVDSVDGAGHIAIYSFTGNTVEGGSTASEFRKALQATRHFPSTILDVRDNGGGSLDMVMQMCEDLIDRGVMIRLVERTFQKGASLRTEQVYSARPGGPGEGRSYVVLAHDRSASASEIFVAALRSTLNVPFVGTRTYGKGVGQASFDTPGGGIAIVTYGTVRTAEGADYNGTGLQPTHPSNARPEAMLREAAAVAVPGALARRAAQGLGRRDAGRATLVEWNRQQAIRPDVVEWGTPQLVVP